MFKFPKQDIDFITPRGVKLTAACRTGTADFNAINAGICDDEYGLIDFTFRHDDVVIDLGAASGGEALLIASMNPKTRIYSFEPLPENYEILKENIVKNKFENIVPVPEAVAGKSGSIKIFYGDPDSEFGRHHYFIGAPIYNKKRSYVEVPCNTLADVFKKFNLYRCKLLKIDTECAELETLQNTPIEILKKIEWIIGEHHVQSRQQIHEATRGLFEDVSCKYQSDDLLGHFRFRRI